MRTPARHRRIRDLLFGAAILSACAGPSSAGGQLSPATPAGQPDPDGVRPYLYEIAPEQVAAQAQEVPFIEVNGTASVDVPPDRATVSFAMETRASGAAQAASTNADAMDAVLRAVRGGSFPDLVVETFGYGVRPEYATNNNRQSREIVAYTAINNVRATTSDVDAVGRLIDLAIGAGANRVTGIGFSAEDTREAGREALAMAVENARRQAETIARALGHQLGQALEVRGGADQPPSGARFRSAAMDMVEMQAAPTPIEASDQTVSANVTIRFALGPRSGG